MRDPVDQRTGKGRLEYFFLVCSLPTRVHCGGGCDLYSVFVGNFFHISSSFQFWQLFCHTLLLQTIKSVIPLQVLEHFSILGWVFINSPFIVSVSCSAVSYSLQPVDCSLLGSSVHGTLQARILEWVAIPPSRGPSRPRDQTQVSCIAGGFLTS